MVDYNNKFFDIIIGLLKNVIEFYIGLDWIDKFVWCEQRMWKQYSLLAWGQKVYLYQFDHDTKTNTILF
jgi:hypothetical protein